MKTLIFLGFALLSSVAHAVTVQLLPAPIPNPSPPAVQPLTAAELAGAAAIVDAAGRGVVANINLNNRQTGRAACEAVKTWCLEVCDSVGNDFVEASCAGLCWSNHAICLRAVP